MTANVASGLSNPTNVVAKYPRTATKTRRRWIAAFVIVVVLAAGGIAGTTLGKRRGPGIGASDQFVVSKRDFLVSMKEKGELKASKSMDVVSEVEGRTRIISLIPEGTAVKEGDLLVELASDQIDDRIRQEELKETNAITAFESARTELEIQIDRNASDIRKANLDIELKKLALERYLLGDWDQQQKDARIAIDQAKINLDRRKQDYEASQKLRAQNFITQTEYQEDEFNHQKAIWELEKAEKAKEVLENYTHVAVRRERESDLEEATKEADRVGKNASAEANKKSRTLEGAEKELALIRDQLTKLRTQKQKCRVVAPTQGFVVYAGGGGGGGFRMMNNDGQIKEGAEVFERQVLIELPDTTEMLAVVRVHEAKTDKLRVGQTATIEVEGVPGKRFSGAVSKIAVLADTQNRWLNPDLKEYETEITLERTDAPLKPGVTAHVEILVESVEDRVAVPVQAVFTKSGKRYVFREHRGDAKPVEVALGSVGTEWVEITKGIDLGDNVLLAATDEQKRQLPELPQGERGPRGPIGGSRAMQPQAKPGADGAAPQKPAGDTASTPPTTRPGGQHERGNRPQRTSTGS